MKKILLLSLLLIGLSGCALTKKQSPDDSLDSLPNYELYEEITSDKLITPEIESSQTSDSSPTN
ncbi:hypothetical protein [uncultured Vagococcus sp.]|uniref:hypothetical protein n=1 Tax=uncultured Vagococcus sp. TaxID=189676 RepID=UPI0028D819F9|nr:hypothetical protein [uncultured Vagococcus sp.]